MNNVIIEKCVVFVGLFSSLYRTLLTSVQEDDSSSQKIQNVCLCVSRWLQMAYKSQHV